MHPIEDDDSWLDVSESAPGASGRTRWWILAVGVVLLGLLATRVGPLSRLVRGEADLAGKRLYSPTHPSDAGALAKIDLERVHAQLLPRWVIVAARRQRGRALAQDETAAFAELVDALTPDRNLVDLAESLRTVVLEGLEHEPQQALYLTWAWSRYLDSMQQPWLVHGAVRATRHGPVFALVVYSIVDEAVISVGVHDQRVRAVRRVDGMNLREAYLGATTRDDPVAIVSIDRLEELATRELWPLLGPSSVDATTPRSAFAEAIRAEARHALGHAHFRTLERTAWARTTILETVDQIHARGFCGSSFRIHALPRAGFDAQRLERLGRFAAKDQSACPSITKTELDRIAAASHALDEAGAELDLSLTVLMHWAAEMVGVHEARHLADADTGADFERGPTCPGCPADLGPATRNELSGYLAALAWSGAPATTLYQACRATALAPGGPHVEALSLIEAGLGVRCSASPPSDLTARARALEQSFLGRSDPIAVAQTFQLVSRSGQ
jgi:hypothetical protein